MYVRLPRSFHLPNFRTKSPRPTARTTPTAQMIPKFTSISVYHILYLIGNRVINYLTNWPSQFSHQFSFIENRAKRNRISGAMLRDTGFRRWLSLWFRLIVNRYQPHKPNEPQPEPPTPLRNVRCCTTVKPGSAYNKGKSVDNFHGRLGEKIYPNDNSQNNRCHCKVYLENESPRI